MEIARSGMGGSAPGMPGGAPMPPGPGGGEMPPAMMMTGAGQPPMMPGMPPVSNPAMGPGMMLDPNMMMPPGGGMPLIPQGPGGLMPDQPDGGELGGLDPAMIAQLLGDDPDMMNLMHRSGMSAPGAVKRPEPKKK